MGQIPTTTNSTAAGINTAIKVVGNSLVSAAETAIIADVPWLAIPGIKQLWEGLFDWISSYFIKAAETESTFIVIDVQTGQEVSALSKAFQAVIAAQKSGDPVLLQKAIQNYADIQSALAHSDGSAPIH